MSVDHTDAYSAEIEDLIYSDAYFLLLEVRQGFIFIVSLYYVKNGSKSLAPIKNLSASHIASAKHSADLVWYNHFLVFSWYLCRSEWNMEIPNDKSQLAYLFLFCHVDIFNYL